MNLSLKGTCNLCPTVKHVCHNHVNHKRFLRTTWTFISLKNDRNELKIDWARLKFGNFVQITPFLNPLLNYFLQYSGKYCWSWNIYFIFIRNEEDVGRAVSRSGVDRKDLFIVTKQWQNGYDACIQGLQRSLNKYEMLSIFLIIVLYLFWTLK